MPEAVKQHVNSNQLPAICRYSLVHDFYFFFCSHLGYLIGSSGDATFTHVENSVRGGVYAFQIHHVIYQNI